MADLRWWMILSLGLLALLRPLTRMTGVLEAPILTTVLLTFVWVAVVGLTRTPRPVLTLVLAGLVYAAAATLLSAAVSGLTDGTLRGPLTRPLASISMLLTHAAWGLVAGLVALGVQRLRARAASRH